MLPKISRYPGHISIMSISSFLLSMPLFLLADVITLNTEADQQHRAATNNPVSPRGASFQNNGGVFGTSVTGKIGGLSCASLPPSALQLHPALQHLAGMDLYLNLFTSAVQLFRLENKSVGMYLLCSLFNLRTLIYPVF